MTQAKFKFTCDANGGDQFTVVSFTGCERVSELYRYDIEVKAPLTATIDLDDVLDSLVHFVIEQDGVEYPVNGILSSFEEFKTIKNYAHYKATLVPRIWKLTNYKTNEIFYSPGIEGELEQGQTVADIVTQVLEKSGMVSSEFDIAGLSGKLLKREYVCQYNESDFDFISRLLENEGIFYYFEQDDLDEKIVFVNDLNYLSIARPKLIFDVAAMSATQGDNVYAWSCRKQRLAERVVVRDYNPDEPSLDVSDTMPIDSMGQGTEYIYGKNVHSDGEATYLSEIRAEQHITRKTQFFGESSVTRLQSGYIFVLEQHPNTKYNGHEYLAIEVNHEGQSLDMAIDAGSQSDAKPQYQNSFVAILADTQFRPELKTKKPKITGTLHARIDGEMDSEYAQLDSEGRYKVSMPFDFHNENHPEGLASARVRMMQPYAGENRGMQFPMAKGTDVLLSFVDGDPDRPIIAGAINTTASPGPVTADNQTESVIQTGGNNKIRMGDEEGKERVVLSTPLSNSWIRMGAHNDPIILQGNATENVVLGDDYTEPNPAATTTRDGVTVNLSPIASVPPFDKDIAGTYRFIYTSAASSTGSDETAIRTVNVLLPSDNSEHEIADQDGIRIRSGSSLWLESGSRYGNYKSGVPSSTDFQRFPYERDTDANPAQVANMLENFGVAYSPTNLKNYKTGALAGTGANPGGTTTEAMVGQDVTVSSLDTFTTQEGNIYDFGGYWNYNLGNSFAEEHINQKPALNKKNSVQWYGGEMINPHLPAGGIASSVTIAVVTGALITGVAVHQGSAGGAVAAGMVVGGLVLVGTAIGVGVHLGSQSLNDNPVNLGDVIEGPGSGPIKTWAFDNNPYKGVGSSFIGVNKDGKPVEENTEPAAGYTPLDTIEQNPTDPSADTGKPMHTDTTWVTKQFGDAYTYNRGNDIDIRVGNTEEHHHGDSYEYRYGGNHEEFKYNGKGTKVHWEQAGGGTKQEARWDGVGGSLLNYEFSAYGKFKYEASFAAIPTLKISTSVSVLQGEIAVSAGAVKIGVNVSAGIEMDVDLCAGLFVKMERKFGGEAELNEVTGWSGFKAIGLKAAKEEAMKAHKQELVMEKLMTRLMKGELEVIENKMTVKKTDMDTFIGNKFYL